MKSILFIILSIFINPAKVTIYGPKGEGDIKTYRGLTTSSDIEKYSILNDGWYDGKRQDMGTSIYAYMDRSRTEKSNTYRISQNDNDVVNGTRNGKPKTMDGVFLHRTNSDGFAGMKGNTPISKGCPVIDGIQWKQVKEQLNNTPKIKIGIFRSGGRQSMWIKPKFLKILEEFEDLNDPIEGTQWERYAEDAGLKELITFEDIGGYYSQINAYDVGKSSVLYGKWVQIDGTIILTPIYSLADEYGKSNILEKIDSLSHYYKLYKGKLHFIGIKNSKEYIDTNSDNRKGSFDNKYPYFYKKVTNCEFK